MGLDRRTIVAVALCVLFLVLYRPLLKLVGWDRYLPQSQPTAVVDTTRRDSSSVAVAPAPPATGGVARPPSGPNETQLSTFAPPADSAAALERTFELETPLYRATFTNRGARLVSVELTNYASANGVSAHKGRAARPAKGEPVPPGDRVVLAGGPLFGLDLGSGADRRDLANVVYTARESLDAGGRRVALTFEASPGGALVRQTYRVRPDNYALDLDVELSGVPPAWRIPDYSLTMRSWAPITEADEVADARALRATSLVGTNVHREHAPKLVDHPKPFDGNAIWSGVQSRYFVAAVAIVQGTGRSVQSSAMRRPLTPSERAAFPPGSKPETEVAMNTLVTGLPSELSPHQRFVLYAGPSEYFRLAQLGVKLERSVDLGWMWLQPVSRSMLFVLKWLNGLIHNYGVAIILLATLVRLLLHPLNVISIKSMRAMQRIQPELERIREKYKNDATSLNTAMMALYKENKVNPAGGCLPMVIQIPVFIGLYNVLFNAIELRQAPFVAWIHDLSAPDLLMQVGPVPIRLLPILMLGSGLLSQKLTPTDPKQLPTMYLMNAFMLVFFYNLPSGLVLYWTLMNLLTALQQWLVLRTDGHVPVVVTSAPEPSTGKRRRAARG